LTATDTADQAENCIHDWAEALLFDQGTSDNDEAIRQLAFDPDFRCSRRQ
jgi:hypothetical protein